MISKKWRKMQDIYLFFLGDDYPKNTDISEQAAKRMYNYESTGHKVGYGKFMLHNDLYNGYAIGKHNMDVTLSMWLNMGIMYQGSWLIRPYELYNDLPSEYHWWLDKVLYIQDANGKMRIPDFAKGECYNEPRNSRTISRASKKVV